MFNSLGEFIEYLKINKELIEFSEKVDPILEVTEISDRLVKSNGPAILFTNVAGCSYPLVMNLFGSKSRLYHAFKIKDFSEITNRIENLLKPPTYGRIINNLSSLPKLFEVINSIPKIVSTDSAPCKEIIIKEANKIDLNIFPIIKCWPNDGGKYITFPIVIVKNIFNNTQNVGMYRMQVIDKNKTAMHWHKHKDSALISELYKRQNNFKIPVCVAIGADPITMYSATVPLPFGVDEFMFASFLRKKPLEVVKSELYDIYVPAHAEIILEGEVDLNQLVDEGPFGDHTGFYSEVDKYPVFEIKAITMRKNPIFIETIVGIPPMEDYYLGYATERIFLPFLKLQCPEIIDIRFPIAGVFHNLVLVKIKKQFKGNVHKVANFFWGQNQLMFTKNIVIFDEDVDLNDDNMVLFTLLSNVDFKRDVIVMEGPVDILDHSSIEEGFGTKIAIDATNKKNEVKRNWPELIKMSDTIKKNVDKKWDKIYNEILKLSSK